MKSMTVRMGVIAAGVALALFGLAGVANAQSNYYTPSNPNPPLAYDGPFTMGGSAEGNGVLGFGGVNATAAAADGGEVGGTGGGLALTGSSSEATVALGIGLMAAGGTAVIAARKRDTDI